MFGVLLAFHILVCILLVVVILLQQRGGGVATVFGGGVQAIFGSSGVAPFMIKLTAALAGVFMITSILLVLLSRPARPTGLLEERAKELQREVAPFAPLEEPQPEGVGE